MEPRDFLLDSHILIWSLYEKARLRPAHLEILKSRNRTWVSAATVWEVEIKKRSGKLPIPDAIWDQAASVGHRFLSIELRHAILAGSLPLHHADPFDRMLVAQATLEKFTLLSVDAKLKRYGVDVLH
jgi:PIN domain nuclease of toxin-antitoxin system